MAQSQVHWTKHTIPSFDSHISHILKLNETELLILLMRTRYHLASHLVSLWSYNILNENYTKVFDESCLVGLGRICYYTSSLDNNKSLLYLFGENGKIVKINLKTEQIDLSL
eukprot:127014_1